MIDAFLSSWDLFQHAYLAGWIAGVGHAPHLERPAAVIPLLLAFFGR